MADLADLAEVAAGLYGVPPAEFTAARTAAVRAARQDGDRDLARSVGALRKPSSAAAAVNLLVRERADDLAGLLDLGVRLREAQAALAGADLRALHAEQQRAVGAAADAALDLLGGAAGAAVRGQVEATLRAAMGDPDAAAAVATGLLVRDLFSSGFEPVDVDGAVAVPGAPPLAGAPGRRTPMRAVPAAPGADQADDDRTGTGDGPPRRRRGRLLTAEEPEQPLRAVPPGAGGDEAPRGDGGQPGQGRRRGRVRVADDGAGAAPAARPGPARAEQPDGAEQPARGQRRTPSGGTAGSGRPDARSSAQAARAERDARDRAARAEREAREQAARAERERRAEAEREARERRRAAAVSSAEHDVALAGEEWEQRRAARDAADDRLRAAQERADELAATIERAREEMERLRAALATAEQEAREVGLEVRHARSARTAAARHAERADQRLRAARAALDAL
ncbi:hypothetical protein MHY85_16080 [Cellulomonas sp. ACRRI]|uniref:hypothetical protein n=1 Tax=Cellulomonas sp. ACRRI TaxID=2918188 RepID=UPI001EF35F3B|nr:hypothetical protein [Cellulomonas sp. ACRRI]MCG7287485.1 hypothetical protein [Cellulomonas sp. ACRRI]